MKYALTAALAACAAAYLLISFICSGFDVFQWHWAARLGLGLAVSIILVIAFFLWLVEYSSNYVKRKMDEQKK